jgi:arylsulfatase A-like enzyme
VVGYDFLPTFYDLAGGKRPLPDEIDGVSIRPLLADPQSATIERSAGALFFHRPRRLMSAIRQGDYKLMVYWSPTGDVRQRILYRVNPNPHEKDPGITAEQPELADKLQRQLLAYLKSVNATMPSAKSRRKALKSGA